MPTRPLVLVVDDDTLVAGLYTRLAEDAGFPTLAPVHFLSELKPTLAAHHVRIVLLDIMMHGANSLNKLRETRRQYPKLNVIVTTGYFEDHFVHQAMDLCCEAMIWKKPMASADVTQAMLEVAAGRTYLSPGIRPLVKFLECVPKHPLTAHQLELYRLLRRGLSQTEIARMLNSIQRNIEARVHTLKINLGLDGHRGHINWRLVVILPCNHA